MDVEDTDDDVMGYGDELGGEHSEWAGMGAQEQLYTLHMGQIRTMGHCDRRIHMYSREIHDGEVGPR